MMIKCPHCGAMVPIKGIGRKPLDIPVNFVCDALHAHSTVAAAARALGCSRGYIYKTLKLAGLTVHGVRA
jgi:hypothetical protein